MITKDSEYPFLYETHMHTAEASACASAYGAKHIAAYKALGFSGIIITDHFLNGNTAVPQDLSWEEKINRFCSGYENAKREGDRLSFPVFFGWEANFGNDEYLIYGLDKNWLLAHPQMMEWNQREQFEHIHADGGAIVQAHPFRCRNYIQHIKLHPLHCDAMEAFNLGNTPEQNAVAYAYCKENHIFMTAGSDNHHVYDMPKACYGMAFSKPLKSIEDFVSCIRNHSGCVPFYDESRETKSPLCHAELPVYLSDYDCHYTRVE